jgi:hypothetical protein
MKQCIRCDREYPDGERLCKLDGAYLVSIDEGNELPPGICPACTGLSPAIDMDGETIMHCPVCHGSGTVSPEEAQRWQREMSERYARREE